MDMFGVARSVFSSLFDIALERSEPRLSVLPDGLTVYVPVTAERCLGVAMTSTLSIAKRAAAAALGSDPDALTSEEAADCMGEALNVIAGQLVADRYKRGVLGLPLTIGGSVSDVHAPGGRLVESACAGLDGEEIRLMLFERLSDSDPTIVRSGHD